MEINNNIILNQLVQYGVNTKDRHGKTPLHDAVLYRLHGVIDALIAFGADINATSPLKRTALHFAVNRYQYDLYTRGIPFGDHSNEWMVHKLLSQENILVNIQDIKGDTPLLWAVTDKKLSIASALLKRGADPNICNNDFLTPLHVALSAQEPCIDLVFLLLSYCPSLFCEDRKGKTPIDILHEITSYAQNVRFIYTFAWQIAVNFKVSTLYRTRCQKRKLERIPLLSQFLNDCSKELERMMIDNITHKQTVFDFFMYGLNLKFMNPTKEVFTSIVQRLVHGLYPNYLYILLKGIPKRNLHEIFANTIYFRFQMSLENYCEKMDHANFFSKMDVLLILSKYLSTLDIFSVIVAFYIGKIPDSKKIFNKEYLVFIKNLI